MEGWRANSPRWFMEKLWRHHLGDGNKRVFFFIRVTFNGVFAVTVSGVVGWSLRWIHVGFAPGNSTRHDCHGQGDKVSSEVNRDLSKTRYMP